VATTIAHASSAPATARYNIVTTVLYVVVVSMVAASSLAYLTSRMGFFHRARAHRRVPRAELEWFMSSRAPSLTVLVPSYREDARTIRMTLLSAALQEYPGLQIVLLIDDPPNPQYAGPHALLQDARAIPGEIERLLADPAAQFREALEYFDARPGGQPTIEEIDQLADHYEYACDWLNAIALDYEVVDHADRFLIDNVVLRLAADLELTAAALRSALYENARIPAERMRHLYERLVWTFSAQLTSFERKQYVSLSHAPNKAMNLNTYIDLMGRKVAEARTTAGVALADAPKGNGRLVSDADYVLTLDADSLLLADYTARLVTVLEDDDHAETAVCQTPYSAIPGSTSKVERIAGATTDMQYIIHQGFTRFSGTYWVGANALLRKRALEDIAVTSADEPTRKYIQDRTVIEDTESSIDLVRRGWGLFNYPRRLSFSATPPDFGALVIQRLRWANGGLLILPKLVCYLAPRIARGRAFVEGFMRTHYLTSIAGANLAFLFLLLYPTPDTRATICLPLTAFPYFAMYARDLARVGYRGADVVRVYALNLVLLPVNLGGVVQSLTQAITGRKSAFRRTPKVDRRTAAPPLYIVANLLATGWCLYGLVWDIAGQRIEHATLNAFTASLLVYGFSRFITWRHAYEDIAVRLRRSRSSRSTRPSDVPATNEAG
jgi:cellulose synthase/poly-beta-1,6-N-acetylglucosamine synthase-like glycosyltransferase